MNQYNIIPELNYWFKIVLQNSPVYDVYYHTPVQVSDSWRCASSVIDLLFNENFNPDLPIWIKPPPDAEDTRPDPYIDNENDRRFIYKYRKCNIKSIQDKTFLNRIQIYRWNANVFVANNEKFLNILDMTGSLYDTNSPVNEVTLPYDVNEAERSPYITYESKTYFSSNYPLNYQPNKSPIVPPSNDPIIEVEENVFNFTEQELYMLDALYDYKVGYQIILSSINYDDLISPLSKLIYIYLDAMINSNFEKYNNIEPESTNILCSLYEKHVLNMLYMLKQKLYCINFNETVIVNEEEYSLDEDMLMAMKITHETIEVKQDDVNTSSIILLSNSLPWQKKDFTIFKKGVVLEQDSDFKIEINKTDIRDPFIKIIFLKNILIEGEILKMFWNYIDPYSAFSQTDE